LFPSSDIPVSVMSEGARICVYQLFYDGKDKATVLDAYFRVKFLADKTAAFIKANPVALPTQQAKLAGKLRPSAT
jgi:hypothetical protein